jgi:hypothetical protein
MHIICYICAKIHVLQERYIEGLKKIHGADVDLKLAPFNVTTAYVVDRGIPDGRYVQVSILFD